MQMLGVHDEPAVVPARDTVLEGEHVRLVPLEPAHGRALQSWVDAGEEGFTRTLASPLDTGGSAERYVDWILGIEDTVPFAVELRTSGEVVGWTRYLHVEPRRRVLHVGGTWYAPTARGTVVNPECKLLLLERAFDLGYNRIQIQTDDANERSKRAITRIGATFEGVSRGDYPLRGGGVRDTWVASVVRSEWPSVRPRLRSLVDAATRRPRST